MTPEKSLERKLSRAVHQKGGLCLKLTSPGFAGLPDRLILLPGGRVAFVELKGPLDLPRPLQRRRIDHLRALGFQAWVLNDENLIPALLETIDMFYEEESTCDL